MAAKKENAKGNSKSKQNTKKKVKQIKNNEEIIVKEPPKRRMDQYEGTEEMKKRVKKEKIDAQTIEILLGLFVLLTIISFFTMGLITTLILDFGILLICACSYWMKKIKINRKVKKVLNVLVIIFLTICIIGVLAVGGLIAYVVATAPELNPENLKYKQSTIIYDNQNNEIAKIGSELRENVSYQDLPQVFIDALVATEDSRYFTHNGFDAPRFLVATIGQLLHRSNAGGASTLSMQVVKNSYTSSEDEGIKGIIRKFTDIYLSVFKLEKEYSKEKIIEFYVNNHPLGGTVYGVEEAAQTYFGKSISDVNLAEAATIAGMFKAPSSYNPILHPEASEKRRSQVLHLMVQHGYLTQEEADAADSIPVESLLAGNKMTVDEFEFQAYIDLVLDELNGKYEISFTQTPVLIYTNMDATKQKGINNIFDSIRDDFNDINYDNQSLSPWRDDLIQGGVAVVENSTGKLVAVGAGRNRSGQRQLNYATRQRQIGSTAKPLFDYGPGIEYENWSTYQQFVDEPWSYTNGPSVNNSDLEFWGQMSLRTALAQSRNVPAVKAIQSLNKSQVSEFVTNLGIDIGSEGLHEAHALGAFNPGASPIEMAGAYAAFASGGYYTEPYTINKIVFRDTGEEKVINPERKQVMSDATAFMITDCLRSAVTVGISNGAAVNGVNVAAKTGTTNYDKDTREKYNLPSNAVPDAWIVGYDPDYTIGMWYGYKDRNDGYLTNITAVTGRSKLFKLLGNVVFSKNGKDFVAPDSVVHSPVEIGSDPALLPSENTPEDKITYEYFKAGTEPTEVSNKYKTLDPVTNLKGTYDEKTKKVTLTWSKPTNIPTGGNLGDFGYNVYFEDTLLTFTTDTSYTFTTEDPNGTYSVRSAFKDYNGNQSKKVTVTIKANEEDSPTYIASMLGDVYVKLKVGDTFTDKNPPIKVIDMNGKDITQDVIKENSLKITITTDGKEVDKVDTSKPAVYMITYSIDYKTLVWNSVRTIQIEAS